MPHALAQIETLFYLERERNRREGDRKRDREHTTLRTGYKHRSVSFLASETMVRFVEQRGLSLGSAAFWFIVLASSTKKQMLIVIVNPLISHFECAQKRRRLKSEDFYR